MADIYVVVVSHNMVSALERVKRSEGVSVPQTKLEVGTSLAENYRTNGCIDGEYFFDKAQRARIFATLCLDFTKALVEKRLQIISALAVGQEYNAAKDSSSDATTTDPSRS
jgi:hypothetical protein